MGGGDLNLKKSWHVGIMSNQRKVWDAEQKAINERKVIEKIRQEREEERAVEELMRLQAESGQGSGNLINPKIAWMYQDTKAGPGGTTTELEGYLLGKRRVDGILLKQDEEKTEVVKESSSLGLGLPSVKDITAKAAMDPLLAIERQRQGNLQNMLQDPIMRRRMMKELAKEKDGDKSHKKHRRDGDRERHHRSKRRRHSADEEDDERERRSHRSHKRRYSESRSRSRSRSPYSRRRNDKHRSRGDSSRSVSPDYKRKDDDSHSKRRDSRRSRSRSPYRKERSERQPRRERSPYSRDRYPRREKDDYHQRKQRDLRPFPSPPDSQRDADAEAERAAKLAAMSVNADDLEVARNKRLAELEARDAMERLREDRKRGNQGDKFVSGLRKQAEGVGLGERLHRGKVGLARLDD